MMEDKVSTIINNEDSKYNDLLCDITGVQNIKHTSESNNSHTAVAEIEAPLSPVLTNSRKSLKHIARRKSRIRLSDKFSQSSFSSQESLQSQINIETFSIESTDTHVEQNDLEERMKRCLEIQKNKKFCYDIAKISNVPVKTIESHAEPKAAELPKSYISKASVENKENDFTFKIPESPATKLKNKTEKFEMNTNLNVGFETGSGKKINLSERALKRAAKLFDDIIDCESPNVLNITNCETHNNKREDTKVQSGFKTGNGNILKVSESALQKTKQIFDDIYESSIEEAEKSDNSDLFDDNTKNEFKIPEIPEDNESSPAKNMFSQITDTQICWAAENAECMADFGDSQWTPSPKNKSSPKKNVDEKNKEIDLSPEGENFFGNLTVCEDGSLRNRTELQEEDEKKLEPENVNFGFSTASGKHLKISEQALKNAEKIFQDEFSNKNDIENVEIKTEFGFSTAGGSKIKLSEKALKKAQQIFQDIDENLYEDVKQNKINNNEQSSEKIIDNESLNKVESTFNDCNFDDNNQEINVVNPEKSEPSNYSSQNFDLSLQEPNIEMSFLASVSVQSEFLDDTINNSIDNREIECNNQEESNEFNTSNTELELDTYGFVFEDALKSLKIVELYKRSFKYIEKDIKNNFFYPISFTFGDILSSKEYKNKNYKYALRSRRKSGVIYSNKEKKPRRSTGNSQKSSETLNLSITTRSKRRSTNEELFSIDIFNDTQRTRNRKSIENSQNCDTNKEVLDTNIKKAIQNLEDEFLNSIENSVISPEIFLSCESREDNTEKCSENKIVNSGESWQTVKDSFDHINDSKNTKSNNEVVSEHNTDNKFTGSLGFSTASGKNVTISEDALKKAKNMFKDDTEMLLEQNIKINKSNGFSTATGKNVKISESALKKAKIFFQDCDFEDNINKNVSSFGFSTASGKNVQISEESLKKTKNIFQDCDLENMPKHSENSINKSSFGFASASGKKVSVSEEALKKAKNIFEDFTENISDNSNKISSCGFASASGKKLSVSEEALKKAKNIFQDFNEDISDNSKELSSLGFASASGKKVSVSEEALKKARNIFQDLNEDNSDNSKQISSLGFSSASGKKVSVSEDALKKAKNIFQDFKEDISDNSKEITSLGFASASGKKVSVSEEALKKARNIFQDINEDNSDNSKQISSLGFSSASGKKVTVSEDALKKARNIFQDCEDINVSKNISSFGFSSASGNKISISEEALKKAKTIFEDVGNEDSKSQISTESGFATASGKNVNISEESSNKVKNIFNEDPVDNNTEISSLKRKINITEHNTPNNNVLKLDKVQKLSANKTFSSPQTSNETTPILRKNLSARSSKKRSLGVSTCKQINIEENTLKRAKLVFDDLDTPKKKEPIINNNLLSCSPVTISKTTPQSTKHKSDPIISSQSLLNSSISMKETNQMMKLNLSQKISPIKICLDENQDTSAFQFRESTRDITKWSTDLQKELEMLKLKMSVIETRLLMVNKQQEIIESGSSDHRRQRPGYLFTQKQNTRSRISLKEAVNNHRPQKNTHQICLNMGLDISILNITPENSTKLQFHIPWWTNDNRTYPAVIRTEDAAVVIPDQHNYIGVREIESAFLAMPGVDPSLVPKKWVCNHYRWIVWKLASMERNYPNVFKGYLTVENVMAQIKYRYDREIDRAQRPAIRKIVECDDTATKRMVLCVADIFKTENQHELELTDGWYSIRTIIDTPLNTLVEKRLITIGMKLITQGAELLNCEGCCPLELPSNVRLQIHYNSTRRAAWHLKLGFHNPPGPLLISLRMISGSGGPIGGALAYIARVYPISFMERSDASSIWRNERAEIRRANLWESEYTNTMENMQAQVQEELEKEWREKKRGKVKIKDVRGVQCGRTLYQFLEESNDPDSVKEMLTSAQISILQQYQIKLNSEHQAELSTRLREKLSKGKIKPRDVCTVLKLLLVDVKSPYHSRTMNIWRPTESHSQLLKEGIVINMFNLTTKMNGSLSSIQRTQFEENCDYDSSRYSFLNRVVTPIAQTSNPDFKPQFGEFDTVGMVVSVDVQQTEQTLWLADENQRFLRIQIRESPNTCTIFDGITPGKIVSVLNLIFKKPMKSYGEAIGSLYSVLSCYPQQIYLQEYMQEFINNLPQDIDQYLEDCQNVVQGFSPSKNNFSLFPFTNTSKEETEIFSRKLLGLENSQQKDSPTLSDEEMALIDTQQM